MQTARSGARAGRGPAPCLRSVDRRPSASAARESLEAAQRHNPSTVTAAQRGEILALTQRFLPLGYGGRWAEPVAGGWPRVGGAGWRRRA